VSTKQSDEADKLKQGKLSADPKDNVRQIGLPVPRVHTVRDLIHGSYQRLKDAKRGTLHCTTGCHELDTITGGFRPAFTWLFGATTSWGKSSWLVAIADENIKDNKRVLIVSFEDDESVYADRLLVRRAQVDAMNFRDGKLTTEEERRVNTVVERAERIPVYLDARRYAVEDLQGHVAKLIAEHQIDLVAFDYIQECRTRRRYQDERVKFKECASILRNIAKDAKIAGLIFSQLTTDDKTTIPTRHNIRDCRDMAFGSEAIVLGFEPDQDYCKGEVIVAEKGKKYIYVDKVKNGPRNRIVKLAWHGATASFHRQNEHGPIVPGGWAKDSLKLPGFEDYRSYTDDDAPPPAEIDQHDDYPGV
jgi:replicative DNA helicase